MPGLKDIQRRIKSVKNTQQITKAMKMVSAAKLRRAQENIESARPYAEKMAELVTSLASMSSPESHPLLAGKGGPRAGLVLITSDRGLCGGFNTYLIRKAQDFIDARSPGDVSLSITGKRAVDHFKKRDVKTLETRLATSGTPSYESARETALKLIGLFLAEELDEVHIIYSQFESALTQTPVVQRLLPLAPQDTQETEEDGSNENGGTVEVIYEPSVDKVLANLLPKYIEVQLYRALLESSASEHGARMTAMDSASRNASDMIGSLTLRFNRLRQAAITSELMEIISGSEALKS
jgi:F-type H+-transporting ATPase subunit gamma